MLVVLWRQDGSEGFAWYVRGIREDGSFYGEVRHQSPRAARSTSADVSGRLTPEQCARVRELVGIIRQASPRRLPTRFAALVERLDPADFGKIGLQFEYRLGDEAASPPARAFLELARILEQHLSPHYARLAEPGAAPDRRGT